MFRVPPLVVMATSSVPAAAPRRADSMMAPVTVSELFGLTTISFMLLSDGSARGIATPARRTRRDCVPAMVPQIGRARRPHPPTGGATLRFPLPRQTDAPLVDSGEARSREARRSPSESAAGDRPAPATLRGRARCAKVRRHDRASEETDM